MGTIHLLHFLSLAAAPPPRPPLLLTNHRNPLSHNLTTSTSKFSSGTRCRSTGYGGRGGRPHWDSNSEKTVRAERFRFNFEDEFVTGDESDGDGRFGAKKRVWWSDDSMGIDDDDDDEEEGGFGVLGDSIDASWVFKVLNAFGWMIPAIVISMLLGTGPNTFFMALVLPLAQSAVTLAVDTFWGRSSGSSPKPKRRTKKKPFSRAASDIGTREEKEDVEFGRARENSQSWSAANDTSTKQTRDKRAPSFGGWDELDKRSGSYKVPNKPLTEQANEPRKQKKGKLSRRVRNRETPLPLRLLIAVFPFLGSWTRLW